MAQKVHSIDSLRTRSLLPNEFDQSLEQQQDQENVILSTKRSNNLRSILKKIHNPIIKRKRLRFGPNQTHIVENWKQYNSYYEEQPESCCTTQ